MSLNGFVDDLRAKAIHLESKIESLEYELEEAQAELSEIDQAFEALSIP